ncbi:hypothetical protein GOV10_02100 [Candidatus Woesearchaeota archaeon]|nr:hypothetical protein [Candidatus Woesearchaeota archaeon]
MAIIGFNFTKIGAQRYVSTTQKVQVTNNVSVTNITESKMGGDTERKTVRLSFRFDTIYEPKTARMQMEGDVLLLLATKEADSLVKGWKDKKVPTTSMLGAMNHVLERCNVQAIILARDLGLPSPVPMPKVDMKNMKAPVKTAAAPVKTAKKAPAKKAKKK